MGGQRGGMVNEAGHFPEVCKKSLQAMVADMQGGITPEFFARYSHRPAANALAARARIVRPARRPDLCRPGRHALPRRSPGTRRSTASPTQLQARRGPTQRSSTPAAGRRTRPASCCSSSPGCTARTTSTTAPTTATRPAASGSARALGTGTATVQLEDVEHADLLRPDRRQPGVEPSAADAHADDASAAAAATSSSSTRRRKSAWSTSACRATSAEPAVRHADRQPVRAAAHRRRHRAAHRHRQARARTRRSRPPFHRRSTPRASTTFRAAGRRRRRGSDDRVAAPASTARRSRSVAEMYVAAKNAVFGWTMGITHHVHGVDNVQAIVNLALLRGMVGRPQRRPAADPRPLQRAGHRLRRRDAAAQAGDPRPARSALGVSCRRRRASTRWPASKRPAAATMDAASASAATCSAPTPTPRSPSQALGKLDLIAVPEHDAQHRPRLGHRRRRRSSCRCSPATKSRSRRRRSRCSTTSG